MHWHVVDDNSWPLVSTTYPNFTAQGAYSDAEVYTHEDVQNIVQYAQDRGIRVVPEFDMPAHAAIWGAGYPDLVISCAAGQTLLDPTGPVYPVLRGLLKEFAPLFTTSDFIHLGGDEVHSFACWEQSPKVQAFMKAHGMTNVTQVRDYFQTQVQNIVIEAGHSTMFWEEVFDGGYHLNKSTVVNVWLSAAETAKVVQSGHRAVHSYGWYLDQQTPPGGTHYFWVDTWQNFYLNDPLLNSTLPPAQQALVLGGEASQWGEQVDSLSIETRMWPRACATAERLWSPATLRDTNAAAPRLAAQRCHMAQLGIRASPIRPGDSYGNCPFPKQQPRLLRNEL